MKDFALCERLQGEMRSLFKEKESLESQLKILQTKARKSNWYEKKRKSSLPPPENSTPASVDIRTLFTNMQKSAESTSSEIQAQYSIEPLNLQNDDDRGRSSPLPFFQMKEIKMCLLFLLQIRRGQLTRAEKEHCHQQQAA